MDSLLVCFRLDLNERTPFTVVVKVVAAVLGATRPDLDVRKEPSETVVVDRLPIGVRLVPVPEEGDRVRKRLQPRIAREVVARVRKDEEL